MKQKQKVMFVLHTHIFIHICREIDEASKYRNERGRHVKIEENSSNDGKKKQIELSNEQTQAAM